MNTEADNDKSRQRIRIIVLLYPFAILLLGIALNLFAFGVNPIHLALPGVELVTALIIASLLLLINHSWLMTATELTRGRYRLYSTPEEWAASGSNAADASDEALRELKRHHDTHLNNTENIVYFLSLALLLVMVSPPQLAAQIWLPGFALARLGYSHSFLTGRDNARGIFMSLSLLALFGIASYLLISLMV